MAQTESQTESPTDMTDTPSDDSPERPPLEPLVTGRTARLMAEDAADQRARDSRGQSKTGGKSRDAKPEIEEPDPIPDAPIPGGPAEAAPPHAAQTAPAAKKRSGSRFGTYLLLLILIAAGAFGSLPWWYPKMPPIVQNAIPEQMRPPAATGVPERVTTDIAALRDRLANTETDIAALQRAISTQTAGAPADTSALESDINALRQRIAALETRPAQSTETAPVAAGGADPESVTALGDAVATQAQQLAAVTARTATLEAALGNADTLTDLEQRIDTLEERSADASTVLTLAARITQVEATAESLVSEQTGSVGFLLAVSQLQSALASGAPYALELETVSAFAARLETVNIETAGLNAAKERGLPTRRALRRQFDELAPAVIRAALLPEESASWLQRTLDRLLAVVSIRRLDDDGSAATGAVITRMERALDDGNLAAAVAAAETLSGLPAQTLAPWLDTARQRVTAEQSLSTLTTQAIAQMGAGRAPAGLNPDPVNETMD